MMVVAAALMAVACSKEEPKVAESKLVGTWKAPLSVGAGSVEGVGGKNLIINANHTASFAVLQFKNWKIEGDVLTFTNVADQGVNREMEVLRYNDSTRQATAYIHGTVFDYESWANREVANVEDCETREFTITFGDLPIAQ